MNTQLEDEVRATLALDPRLLEPVDVAVCADGGIVTLRGTVWSFKQRRAAVEDARKIAGVYEVVDKLEVHLRDDVRDDVIRGAALQSLIWDANVPADSIEVKVSAGWATLSGQVAFQFQSDAAFDDVAMIRGVGGITNKIEVITPRHAGA
ncbi:MAG TPA: BON domain-containing protein [Solirubrobacteraceae bacterium]|nr:BON domain-containing protein [Solirubrobacteraceae bacterium]